VLGSLDSDLLDLIETGEFRLETMKELEIKNPGTSNRPGIYVHMIYSHDYPNVAGIYVGSADRLAARIGERKKAQKRMKHVGRRGDANERRSLASRLCIRSFGRERGIGISGFASQFRPPPKCDREGQRRRDSQHPREIFSGPFSLALTAIIAARSTSRC